MPGGVEDSARQSHSYSELTVASDHHWVGSWTRWPPEVLSNSVSN